MHIKSTSPSYKLKSFEKPLSAHGSFTVRRGAGLVFYLTARRCFEKRCIVLSLSYSFCLIGNKRHLGFYQTNVYSSGIYAY